MVRTIAEIKAFFETGDVPTAAQYIDLIDTLNHMVDLDTSGIFELLSSVVDGTEILRLPNNRGIAIKQSNGASHRIVIVTNSDIYQLGDIDNSGDKTYIKGKNNVKTYVNNVMMQDINTFGVIHTGLTTTQINAISSPTEGLEVYDSTLHVKKFWNGSVWKTITTN